jgi:hypothetical protein
MHHSHYSHRETTGQNRHLTRSVYNDSKKKGNDSSQENYYVRR